MPQTPGHRDLTESEVAVLEEIREEGERLRVLIAKLRLSKPYVDDYWLAKGELDLKTGVMALVRAVTHPTVF